mmetsp:Transcript_65643/g.97218  ORF Transcript_65643/g.97218 Transcript_65643/m.97218 type:complete len:203 (-) Transcript_65643:1037-1645(-)
MLVMMRQLIRDGKIPCPEDDMNSAFLVHNALKWIREHEEILRKHIGRTEVDTFSRLVDNAVARMEDQGVTRSDIENGKFHQEFVAIDDDDHDLVYGIGVNSLTRRIILAFRGTETYRDILTDLDFIKMKSMPNPLSHFKGQPEYMFVHSGFYKYLYGMPKRLSKETFMDKTRFRNKCDEILSHIEDLLEAFPGYTLYVTGHR